MNDFNLKKVDGVYLILLSIISLVLIDFMFNFYFQNGMYSTDVYTYLNNALVFYGNPVNDGRFLYLSPVISYITSIFFKMGYYDERAILITTGIFAYLGFIGMYLLLKNRFSSILSFMGTLLYFTFSLNLIGLANGMLDLPACSIIIWVLLFMTLSIDKNPKYFMVLIPLFAIGLFVRYTIILILPAVLLYYLLRRNIQESVKLFFVDRESLKMKWSDYRNSDEFRYILKGILIAVLISAVIFVVITLYGARSSVLTQQTSHVANTASADAMDVHYDPDRNFYIDNYLIFLNSNPDFSTYISRKYATGMSYFIVFVVSAGILAKIYDLLEPLNDISGIRIKDNALSILAVAGMILIPYILHVFNNQHNIIQIALVVLEFLLLDLLLKRHVPAKFRDNRNMDFIIALLCMFSIYMVFFSLLTIKVDRYVMPSLIAVAYLFVYSVDYIQRKSEDSLSGLFEIIDFNEENKRRFLNRKIIPVILIVIILLSTANVLANVEKQDTYENARAVQEYIKENIPDYQDKTIATSFKERTFAFDLKMPLIRIKRSELERLDEEKVDYYISKGKINKANYVLIYEKEGNMYFKHKNGYDVQVYNYYLYRRA